MRKLSLVTVVLALGTAALFPTFAPAGKPDKSSFDFTVSQTVTGICPFPVDITSTVRGHAVDFYDRDGVLIRINAHITEQDTFTANGKSVTGDPFTFSIYFYYDENGQETAVLARGVAEKIRLPNAKLFLSAGVIDFLAQNVGFSFVTDRGRTGDVDAFCAALA